MNVCCGDISSAVVWSLVSAQRVHCENLTNLISCISTQHVEISKIYFSWLGRQKLDRHYIKYITLHYITVWRVSTGWSGLQTGLLLTSAAAQCVLTLRWPRTNTLQSPVWALWPLSAVISFGIFATLKKIGEAEVKW